MVQVQGPAAQTRNRESQTICSSKTFTTITDQPCQKEARASCLPHHLNIVLSLLNSIVVTLKPSFLENMSLVQMHLECKDELVDC